ncbi:MAG: hydantoinase/carbamoylase family amidase [Thermomicrobia bacterium]|nr:hydantoinase/carbamoylase family amidase [Thermomicrobia bacterium]
MTARVLIDPALVERCVFALAAFGASDGTGVRRAVYTPEWMAAQTMVAGWCEDAGLAVHWDAVGSVWGRLDGTAGGTAIVSGSHIDTQLPGGRYDGALGVIAGYVAIAALKEQFGPPKRPLEVVSFCQEESSRFPRANFWASRAVVGRIAPHEAEAMRSYADETMADVMRAVGLDPDHIPDAARDDIETFIELHIEQGPLLEEAGLPVAVVNAITGLRGYTVAVHGRADHAGAFPMDLRRDPMAAAAEIILGVRENALAMGRPAVTTVGRIAAEPNFPAIVPERVTFSVDARHPDPAQRAALYERHEALFRAVAARRNVAVDWQMRSDTPPCICDPALVRLLETSAREQGIQTMTMQSGAGHDSQIMAARSKVAMLFVRSKDGRSHTPEEFTTIEDAVAGIEVLAGALHTLAY